MGKVPVRLFSCPDQLELTVACASRGELHRQTLELGAHEVGVADVTGGWATHENASAMVDLHKPLRLHVTQSLAYRLPTDAEALGQSLLAKPPP